MYLPGEAIAYIWIKFYENILYGISSTPESSTIRPGMPKETGSMFWININDWVKKSHFGIQEHINL